MRRPEGSGHHTSELTRDHLPGAVGPSPQQNTDISCTHLHRLGQPIQLFDGGGEDGVMPRSKDQIGAADGVSERYE